jgi:hypothetical protein
LPRVDLAALVRAYRCRSRKRTAAR